MEAVAALLFFWLRSACNYSMARPSILAAKDSFDRIRQTKGADEQTCQAIPPYSHFRVLRQERLLLNNVCCTRIGHVSVLASFDIGSCVLLLGTYIYTCIYTPWLVDMGNGDSVTLETSSMAHPHLYRDGPVRLQVSFEG